MTECKPVEKGDRLPQTPSSAQRPGRRAARGWLGLWSSLRPSASAALRSQSCKAPGARSPKAQARKPSRPSRRPGPLKLRLRPRQACQACQARGTVGVLQTLQDFRLRASRQLGARRRTTKASMRWRAGALAGLYKTRKQPRLARGAVAHAACCPTRRVPQFLSPYVSNSQLSKTWPRSS